MPSNNKIIHCAKAQEFAQLLLDGRLTSTQREQLDSHLLNCKQCSEYFEKLRLDSGLLSEWTPSLKGKEPGDAFNEFILDAIRADREINLSKTPAVNWNMALSAGCVIALSIIAGFFIPPSFQIHSYQALMGWFSEISNEFTYSFNFQTNISWSPNLLAGLKLGVLSSVWGITIGATAIAINIYLAAQTRLKSSERRHG
jgi:predicted anti-sigma-YlaC factor YlaD